MMFWRLPRRGATRGTSSCVGLWTFAALAGGLAGCSTHPLPEDVSRVATVDIVKSIRCEARAGMQGIFDAIRPEQRDNALSIIKATVIGYDFRFDIGETNGADGNRAKDSILTFSRADRDSSVDLTGSASLNRSNKRNFTIIEPLAELAKEENEKVCKDREKGPNWSYPITGTIGLDEVVRTYVKLELLTELQKQGKAWPGAQASSRFSAHHVVFSDELEFHTIVGANASAGLVLDAGVGRLRLSNASIGVAASRDDRHSLIVAMTRPTIDVDERVVAARTRKGPGRSAAEGNGAREERGRLIEEGSVRDPRSQARLIQMNALPRDSVAVELQQRRARNSDENEAARALGQRFLDVLRVP